MNRFPVLLCTAAFVCLAASDSKPPERKADMAEMPADAHAPLFRQKAPDPGRTTQRLTAELAKPGPTTPVPHRNFIDDEIFGRMQRDGIPHAPLATDQEFLRRVKLDLAGRIPQPSEVR